MSEKAITTYSLYMSDICRPPSLELCMFYV